MRSRSYQNILVVLLIFIIASSINAQFIKTEDIGLYKDYLLENERPDKYSGGYYVINETDSVKWQSPTAALFKSMFIPGWGQLGNRQYIKAGIAIGAEAVLFSTIIYYAQKTSDAKKAFDKASISGDDNLQWKTFQTFDNFRDRRNLFSWITGAVIFWSMFDAYVDAHMARFPKYDNKISLGINSENRDEFRATVAFKF